MMKSVFQKSVNEHRMKALAEGIELAKMSHYGNVKIQRLDQSKRRGSGIWVKPHFLEKLYSLEKARGIENWPQLGYYARSGEAVPQKPGEKADLKWQLMN